MQLSLVRYNHSVVIALKRGITVEPADCNRIYFTYKEAAERLGVHPDTIKANVHTGIIARVSESARLSAAEVEKWEKFFTTINSPFDSLYPQIASIAHKPPTISIDVAAKRLGLDPDTVSRWIKWKLLPCYPEAFARSTKKCRRGIVKNYVEGLRRYALGAKLNRSVAREYLELCQARGRVF